MATDGDMLDHARAAVERTARSLADMRARLQAAAPLGRQHRQLIESALHDLGRRHEALAGLYEAMIGASAEELPGRWQKFFACYDDCLEAMRDARSRLIQDKGNDPVAPATTPPGTGRSNGQAH